MEQSGERYTVPTGPDRTATQAASYVRFVDSFPMAVTSKIQKFMPRRQMAEELGLGD